MRCAGLLVALQLTVAACGSTVAVGAPRRRILMVGNSLTYANDLPGMVQALSLGAGGVPLEVASIAKPDFSLGDHLGDGDAARAIARGWEVVVLQQGPSALPESRADLRRTTPILAGQIRKAGGRPALYMVWPSAARAGDLDRVIETYTLAAADVDGLLFPVGAAWRAAWRHDPTLPLYVADGFHPSLAGSYLAALVIIGRLYHRPAAGLPASFKTAAGQQIGVQPDLARTLQAAADEALSQPDK